MNCANSKATRFYRLSRELSDKIDLKRDKYFSLSNLSNYYA